MYRPLLLRLAAVTSSILSSYGYLFSRHSSRHQSQTKGHQLDQMTRKRKGYDEFDGTSEHVAVVSTPAIMGASGFPREELPVNGIRATKTVEVV